MPLPLRTICLTASHDARSVAEMSRNEWLLTNGLGGFAMGTASGVPTRRYHGLLVGATTPPTGRVMALSAMVETLVEHPDGANGARREFALSSMEFRGQAYQPAVLHPDGALRLEKFEKDLTCRWEHLVKLDGGGRVRVHKELCVYEGMNAACVRYRVVHEGQHDGPGQGTPLRLHVRPLVALRDMHELLSRSRHEGRFSSSTTPTGVRVEADTNALELLSDSSVFLPRADWWHGVFYRLDQERGQECFEDLWSPGEFLLDAPGEERGASCVVQASFNGAVPSDIAMLEMDAQVKLRRQRLAHHYSAAAGGRRISADDANVLAGLVVAADDFVVARAERGGNRRQATVIAGYPWFGDWGRDTCIALPGLLLTTGRHDEALRALEAFAGARKHGVIPNLFNDRTGEAEYNTVDASLWFVHAACAYLNITGDRAGFERALLPACVEVIEAYRRGTIFNIAMDPADMLIAAGSEATQLTWMDAKRDGVVFTPRHGKAVEINALWVSVLKSLSACTRELRPELSANCESLSRAAAGSFRTAFWNPELACLFDVLVPTGGGWRGCATVRPNQVFAVSLPHSALNPQQQQSVLRVVREKLLTKMGLRTLERADAMYKGRYEGSLFERDAAYHNGTAWPWLLGAYAEGVLRVGQFSDLGQQAAQQEARLALRGVIDLMMSVRPGTGACLGQIAEVFDGDQPQRPGGCTAQAWSVGETLRVWAMTLER